MRHFRETCFPSMLDETLANWDYLGIRVISVVKGGIVQGQYAHIAFTLVGYGPSPEPGKPAPETVVEVPDVTFAQASNRPGLRGPVPAPPSSPVGKRRGK